MSRIAWLYIWLVFAAGVAFSALALTAYPPQLGELPTFAALTALATFAELFKANTPNRKLYFATLVFYFAGVLLLHPFLFVLMVVISCCIEWAKERLTDSPDLRDWYLQPFNISMHIILGTLARSTFGMFNPGAATLLALNEMLSVLIAALVYVVFNQLLIGVAVVLARGMSWRDAFALDVENIQADLIHLLLGYVVAGLWQVGPWLILPALAPLLLTYRALMVPQLKREAQIDGKTGLLNASHFGKLFSAELGRARRFGRPLAMIMADLDLLRNINNTYGHIAGDAVLSGVGRIIREVIREYDIAGRFGGEEFCVVLPETGLDDARIIAERIRQVVENMGFRSPTTPEPVRATMSFGIACFPADAATTNDLIHQADVAVYQAKLNGRNRVVPACDIPRSLKMGSIPGADRLATPYYATWASPSEAVAADINAEDSATNQLVEKEEPAQPKVRFSNALLWLFVAGVIIAGTIVAWAGLSQDQLPSLATVGVLCIMAMLAEFYEVGLYGDSTFSVSLAIAFAAVLTVGVLGVVSVSMAIALAHYLRNKNIALYKLAFNWAVHVLAGMIPIVVFRAFAVSLTIENIIPLTLLTLVAALVYYFVESGLVSIAMGVSGNTDILTIWREQFRWTAAFYVALALVGLFMGVVYADSAMGLFGLLVFAIPMVMIHFSQKQYIDRTQASVHELQRMNKELLLANNEVISANRVNRNLNDELFLTVARIIDARDPYVLGHALKVAEYATAIATELRFPPERLEKLRQAALLHDIGKIGIPEQILNKPGKLTGLEYEQVKCHTTIGADLLEASQGLRHLMTFVRHHHEWWNGSGYPDRWEGEQIPLEARILSVCDAVESMASDRPYHSAMELDEIIAEIKEKTGTQFDPEVVRVCERVLKRQGEPLVVNSARQSAKKHSVHFEGEKHGNWLAFPRDAGSSFVTIAE